VYIASNAIKAGDMMLFSSFWLRSGTASQTYFTLGIVKKRAHNNFCVKRKIS
jgi:hypothetical protein